jgi:membrane-associated protease RseP (regulator of RpoE activity)
MFYFIHGASMTIRSLLYTGAITVIVGGALSIASAQSHSSSGTYVFQSARDQGHLGVAVTDVTADLKKKEHLSVDQGAYVLNVDEESPAEKAEIREGDVIIRFDGEKIDDSDDLIRMVRRTRPKKDVPVELVRKDEHKVVTATIGREPGLRSYSFNFGDRDFPRILRIPRMPRLPRLPHGLGMIHPEAGMVEFLGLGVEELTKQLAGYFEVPGGKGILVTEVEPGSAADSAGFRAGDVILKAGGNTVRRIEDLREELSGNQEKETSVEILRKGKQLTLQIKPEADDGMEGEDEGLSGSTFIPRHEFALRHQEFTERTMEALREFLRRFKNDLKSGLRELREDLHTHFSKL